MSEVIKEYYKKTKLEKHHIDSKLVSFSHHEDIEQEFECWIKTKEYKNDGIVVEGYSAKVLANISKFLDGEGAFVMLIALRENPEKAVRQIKAGFKVK